MNLHLDRGIAARLALVGLFMMVWSGAMAGGPQTPSMTVPQAAEAYGNLPLIFEANQGQADSRAKFIARGQGYSVFLSDEQLLVAPAPTSASTPTTGAVSPTQPVLRMRFVGAKPGTAPVGERPLTSRSHYFRGGESARTITDVAHFAAVRRADIYPGIDAVFYGNRRQLEYDFVVAPGADPRLIRLRFTGVGKVTIDRAGRLLSTTAGGEFIQHAPVIYQLRDGQREPIEGRYIRRGNDIGLAIAAYDRQRALIIDPVLSYATFLGGVNADVGNAIAADSAGNAYITGFTQSPRFPRLNAVDTRIGHSEQDVFVSKLNATGTALLYSTYIGGAKGIDSGNGIAVDSAGNAYVAGSTTGTGFPLTTSAYQRVGIGFVFKLNPAGNALVYSTYLTGAACNAIAIDASGNAYVTGYANASFTTTTGSFQSAALPKLVGASKSAFVAKLNASGSALIYGTFVGGTNNDEAKGIAIDSAGNAYIAGVTNSIDFPTVAALQGYRARIDISQFLPPSNAFVSKLNASGSALAYSTYLGGSYRDLASAIAVDAQGSAHVTGLTTSPDFPVANAFQPTKRNNEPALSAAFVSKYTPDGTAFVYSSFLGGVSDPTGSSNVNLDVGDRGAAVAIDTAGNAWFAGSAYLTSFPVRFPILPDNRQGSSSAFLAKVSPGGLPINTLLIGGSGFSFGYEGSGDSARGIALDRTDGVYLTGRATSQNFPVTSGAAQTILDFNARTSAYGEDAFVAKVTSANYLVTLGLAANPLLANQSATLSSTVTLAGNPVANGSVAFYAGSALLGTPSLSAGNASLVSPLAVGIRRLTAVFTNQGDGGGSALVYALVNPTGTCQTATSGTLPAPTAPLIVLTAPIPCTTYASPATVSISADTFSLGARITSVDYFANGAPIGRSTALPHTITWNNPAVGNYALTALATNTSGISTTSTPVAITVVPPNAPPTVSLTEPVAGASFRAGGSISLRANATDNDGSIVSVTFLVNGSAVGSTNVMPYSGTWSNITPGSHTLSARALDNQGAISTSAAVAITVTPNNPPTVALTAPSSGNQYVAPAEVAFAATAADSDGTVARVEFLLNGNVVGSATTAPYIFTAANLVAGSYTATARAVDNDGAATSTAGVIITIAANQPPNVAITSPVSGAAFIAPVDVTITASATDPDGSVAKVEFFAGTTLIGTVIPIAGITSPYTFIWRNVVPDTYFLTVKATDERGATRISTGASITVTGTSVTITAPINGASFTAPANISIGAAATTTNGNLVKLDYYDGTTLVGTLNVGGTDLTATFNLFGVTAGTHVYTVKATTSTMTTATSAPVTVNVAVGPTVSIASPSANASFVAPATIHLSALAAAVGGSVTKVEYFSDSILLGSATVPPFDVVWNNVAQGSYTVKAKVTSSANLATDSTPVTVTVLAAPTAAADAGQNGTTINEETTLITGTVQAPPNSAVTVNGQLATRTDDGRFFVNDVPLTEGANTLTVQVTTQDNQTSTQSITMNRMGAANFRLNIDTAEGFAPLAVNLSVDDLGLPAITHDFERIEFDLNGDGVVDYVATSLAAANITANFPVGLTTVRITIKARDINMNLVTVYTTEKRVYGVDPVVRYNLVKGVYRDMVARLTSGNVDLAVGLITELLRDQFRSLFVSRGANLAADVASLGKLESGNVSPDHANLLITRDEAGDKFGYYIYLVRAADGIWRIDGM